MSDEQVRRAALEVDRHVLLQAPAGSGKTTVLAQRFLHALAVVDEPEQVLAITFTRKAAAEMRERVLKALEDGIDASQADSATWMAACAAVRTQAGRRGWDLVELPQRLRIQTIDSLAHEVARTMPLLGRIQTTLAVTDDAAELYRAAARLTLREGESDPAYSADVERLLRRLENNVDQAQQLFAELLPNRNRWLPWLVQHPPDELGARVAASLAGIVESRLRQGWQSMPAAWWEEGAALAQSAAAHRRDAGQEDGPWRVWLGSDTDLAIEIAALTRWQTVVDLALKADGDLRGTVNKSQGFPTTDKPLKLRWQDWIASAAKHQPLVALLRSIRSLPSPLLDAGERAALASLARVMLLAAAQLKLVFRDAGCVDYGEIAAIARLALNTDAGLGENTLRHTLRISHLLIDEFQDTSPDQLDLVQALTRHWQPGDGRSLFCVGDPMQSIYLFRNSEVGLFLQVRARGVGDINLEALRLTSNFRSQPPLVEWSNRVFVRIFPPAEDLRSSAVTFLGSQAARGADERLESEVRLWPQVEDDTAAEARTIAEEIVALRATHSQLSIAVLVQTRALAGPIMQALRAAGVAALGVDLVALAERAVVRDLVSLGQALLDAGDRTAWLAVLRAPACGLTLTDLLLLCEAVGPGPLVEHLNQPEILAALSADGRVRLERVGPVLRAAWYARGSLDIAGNIEECWYRLGGAAACRDPAELATARQYLLALRSVQEREGPARPTRLADLAARLLDRGEADGAHPVEVLTIHRAKGLEWDVVFVPGLGRRPGTDRAPLLRALELPAPQGGTDLLLAVRSIGRPNSSDPLARYIRELQAERLQNERLRLLYVAATRPKLRLYLSGHAASGRDGQPRPRAGSLLELLWPALGAQFGQASAHTIALPPADPAPLVMLWQRVPADLRMPAGAPPPQIDSLVRAQTEPGETGVEFSWVGPLARAAGTIMHAELERLASLGEPAAAHLPERAGQCAAGLREQGIAPREAERSALQILQRLVGLVQAERARWLLFTAHREAASELRLSGIVDGELRNVVIDRSFVDGVGTRWIVDYKTSVHSGSGLEEFVARELARYAPQLRLYSALARRLGPEPVRAALFFPWLGECGEFRELSAASDR